MIAHMILTIQITNNMESFKEESFLTRLNKVFKKKLNLVKGQLGVYHDKLAFYTENDGSDVIKHNIYVKIKIVEVYDELVEIEVLDFTISDSASQDIINLVKNNMPKYVNPRIVKWQIIEQYALDYNITWVWDNSLVGY